jgi:hypothetical protein
MTREQMREKCEKLCDQLEIGYGDSDIRAIESFALSIRNEALDEAANRIDLYRRTDKYVNQYEKEFTLLNAQGLIRALKDSP